uniref:Uncharacterized protein n=1 Tax=Anguilla anguilla TaxID=7936 RepID=A0A0E9RIE4_ANGAN
MHRKASHPNSPPLYFPRDYHLFTVLLFWLKINFGILSVQYQQNCQPWRRLDGEHLAVGICLHLMEPV